MAVAHDAARRAVAPWEGDPESLEHLGTSENAVYRFSQGGTSRILRLTSPEHRSAEQIAAELGFVKHLHAGGVRSCRPLSSRHAREVEAIPDGSGVVLACAFEEASGDRFQYSPGGDHTPHFRSVGRTLGRIHTLSRRYQPDVNKRLAWSEDPCLVEIDAYLPKDDDVAWREYDALAAWLSDQPADEVAFGLIHGDFGSTNYLKQGDALAVFDFDDACYQWYAYDLAIVLYPHGWRKEARQLYAALTEGYSAEAEWDGRPLDEMTPWCRLRMLYMYLHTAYGYYGREMPADQVTWMARTRENMARGYRWGS